MSDTLRIAIAGTGFGAKYAVGLQAQPDVQVVGVFSRRAERAAQMAEQFEIPFWTRDFEELLKLPGLDAIAIVTPNSTHCDYVQAALRAGKHVICDKPLALTGGEAADLHHQAEARRLRHVTFVPYRFSPASLAVKAAMDDQRLGRLIGLRAAWGVDMRAEPLRWRFQRNLSGPGVVADLGAHILDLAIWWAGPIRRALGRCRTMIPQRPMEAGGRLRPVDVPDECYALFEFADRGIGSATLSWNIKRDQRIEIQGDRGTLIYESPSMLQWLEGKGPFTPTVTFVAPAVRSSAPSQSGAQRRVSDAGRRSEVALPSREDFASQEQALARMFRDIVTYLKGGEKSDCVATFADGAAVLKTIDALVASDATGAWADIAGSP